jgi:Ser/Thr protein kinase RdoA (MazF antagonist)
VAIEPLSIEQIVSKWYQRELNWQEPRISFRRYSRSPLNLAGVLQNHLIYLITATDISNPTRRGQCVLKIYHGEEKAREEFDNLAKLSLEFRKLDQSFGVPAPLALFPDIRGLLISRVPGKRLDDILWPSPGAKDRNEPSALDAVRRAASWLASYQTIPSHEEPHNLKGEILVQAVRSKLDPCRQQGLAAPVVKCIASWLTQVEHNAKDITSTCVNTCNFKPNHILISNEETTVIDFGDGGRKSCGWLSNDLVMFLAYCGVYKKTIYPMSISFETLCDNFLRTYSSKIKFHTNEMMLLEISYVLELLDAFLGPSVFVANHADWRKSGNPIFLNRWFSWRCWLPWIAYLAKREMVKRTAEGTWQTLLKEYHTE